MSNIKEKGRNKKSKNGNKAVKELLNILIFKLINKVLVITYEIFHKMKQSE